MKTKLLLLDLSICSLWMLSLLGGRDGWYYPGIALAVLGVMMRFVVSFSLYFQEKRSWLPLALFAVLAGLLAYTENLGVGTIPRYFFYLTHLEYSEAVRLIIGIVLFLWIYVAPFVCLLFSLGNLRRADLTWKELLGGILWHDRFTMTCSAVIAVMFLAFLTGMSMTPPLCQVVCITSVPFTYWLLCHCLRIKSEYLWLLVVSMIIFWYGQLLAGVWRTSLLLVSFGLVTFVGTRLYKNTQNLLLTICSVLYLGVILPSFSIGYNQYACINYARSGFYYLNPFKGIFYITDSSGELYGLRDRYGLLLKPEFEHIGGGFSTPYRWSFEYSMQKDGYTRFYDVLNNEFVNEPTIKEGLQHSVREILENHFACHDSDYDDRGQIKVTDLLNRETIADVRVCMYGNPVLNYDPERFIADDSIEVASCHFFHNDSVVVYNDMLKQSLSYAVNTPDTLSRYRIYVRLATDSIPADTTLLGIAEKVAALPELNR